MMPPSASERPTRAFFEGDTPTLARRLLGCTLWHRTPEGLCAGRIVETEAYCGETDAACHSYTRRAPNGRTSVMYGPGGFAYVYLIYGMHCCMNVVSAPEGAPEAVLIRALAPTEGIALMRARRPKAKTDTALCSGPGKLCAALGIDRGCYGLDLLGDTLFLTVGEPLPEERLGVSPRIGVAYAGEDALRPWRFFEKDDPNVSKPAGGSAVPQRKR